jgi:ketosteroid isomerase-like protein
MLTAMTLDEVIAKMYASMSFERGQLPDWRSQSEVFATDARLVRVRDDGVFEFDPRTFRKDYEAMITSGALTSLFERELWREAQVYGDIAHVLSSYEIRTSHGGDLVSRAMKSIQLFQKDGRWWISAMIWRRENDHIRLEKVTSPR